ncbi:MAG: metalloregulator ArsR/SmtB family transcription factor [Euryarchaeota archaeon]|nr:metalloregulator ArsR/SmtB family transcription factor [Euryarchaeota archaeon]
MLKIIQALANEYRLKIMELLSENEMSPNELKEELGITRGGLERHLSKLLESELINKRSLVKRGKVRVYFCLDEACRTFFESLKGSISTLKLQKSKNVEETLKLLSVEFDNIKDALQEIEWSYANEKIDEDDYLELKREYVSKMVRIEKEIALLLEV